MDYLYRCDKIIDLFLNQHQTQAEIARGENVTRERIRQILPGSLPSSTVNMDRIFTPMLNYGSGPSKTFPISG